MKRQIRRGVFETNSSSTHSLTIVSAEDYKKWENGEVLLQDYPEKFVTLEEAKEYLEERGEAWENDDELYEILRDYEYHTHDSYFDNDCLESFTERHTTPNGDTVVAFGMYGYNG